VFPTTVRLLLKDVRETFSALSVNPTLPSVAIVLTVEAELLKVILPLAVVDCSAELLTEPRMSAASARTDTVPSAITLKVSWLAESVLVPDTVKLLLFEVSDTLPALRERVTLPSVAVVLIVEAVEDRLMLPLFDDAVSDGLVIMPRMSAA
jgi:hypothetical protein